MNERLLYISIQHETDVVLARQRTRQLAESLGFDKQDQTRVTTAVSEIARNAFEYGRGGRAEFFLIGTAAPQLLEIVVTDNGPGIDNLEAVLNGMHHSPTGMGLGLLGAQRLMDQFNVESRPGAGVVVRLRKFLPSRLAPITGAGLQDVVRKLAAPNPLDPLVEIRRQNQELLLSLEESRRQHEELNRLNQELEDTNRGVVALYAELDERADHLRRADELKSRFLSNMSHEFRTPLNSIMALSRLLLDRVDGDLSVDQEKQIKFVRKSAENLTELVNDLLDLAKVEAGKVDVRPVEVSVDNLFSTLRGMLRPLLAGDRVALIFDDVTDVPPLFSDESKVAQILRNLISNAIKFTERGEVRVSAGLGEDGLLELAVRDTGLGISDKNQELIFQEFVQIENPAQKHYKGTGLGLPLSKRLAELLGGTITLKSAPGEGSTFTLRLPLTYVSAPEHPAEVFDKTSAEDGGGVPLLVLEDDPAVIYVYQRVLSGSLYRLIHARTVAAARQVLQQVRPAAIILDLVLIGEDSWKFLAFLKQESATRDIPVIVVSTLDDEGKAGRLGADHYLRKPVTGPVLIDTLALFLNIRKRIKVLLIEDEETFRYVIRQSLPAGSYELTEAATGLEGLRIMREMIPDVVLLDINLPDMTGLDIMNRSAEDDRTRSIPMIIVTAEALDPDGPLRRSRARRIVSKQDISAELLASSIGAVLGVGAAP